MRTKKTYNQYLRAQLKNRAFQKAYERETKKLEIAYKILQARKRARLTQQELEKKIGTTQSVIARIEQGEQNMTIENLERIASALNRNLEVEFA